MAQLPPHTPPSPEKQHSSPPSSTPPPPPAAPPAAPLTPSQVAEAATSLRGGPMFRRCSEADLTALASHMSLSTFTHSEQIVTQSSPTTSFFVLISGSAQRRRTDPSSGAVHHVTSDACGTTVNSLQLISGDPVYATATCSTPSCTTYALSRDAFLAHIASHPSLARGIIEGLSRDARRRSQLFRTPLLHQNDAHINYASVAVAAATESYYRSALNSLLNARLSGVSSPLFPNMHVQVPTRVAYITGFKGLRAFLDANLAPDAYASPTAVRVAAMVGPGVVMTPISSILEAANATSNPEPLLRKSLRGSAPRCAREIIFGIGINQMSDYFEERLRTMSPALQLCSNPLFANLGGSVVAGVFAGYASHVPHSLSTLKILEPKKGYGHLFRTFVDRSVPQHLVPKGISPRLLPSVRVGLACLFPRGVVMYVSLLLFYFYLERCVAFGSRVLTGVVYV